ncbi:uncharacterized protein LOC131466961 [Solea solea]|uniref:uncharacterized protein LOC131466961 n=1 Tax=Solea solea TaxID=90069 RepID=UPI00272BB5F3|nr:uncharacterized protein LOC131466961 [Solea solea]
MTGVVYVAAAVLSFLSVGQSAPVTDCESLIQPVKIQDREQLLGKWIYLAESTNFTGSKLLTNMLVETVWGKMTAANEIDAIHHYQSLKMFGQCFAVRTNLTLENNTFSMVQPYPASAEVLKSGCADCLVFHIKYSFIFGRQYRGLQLLSKRTNVSTAELQEFKKQVECLNLPPPAILVTDTGLCPDESSSQETETVDLTSHMGNMDPQVSDLMETILGIGSALDKLASLFTSA